MTSPLLMQPLVSLSPPDVLTFQLVKDTAPRTVLRITNVSGGKIAFKVKTTQPSWYYVRPNQQVVDVGQSEEVTIVLVETECNRFIQNGDAENKNIAVHRFLVQSKPIDAATYDAIMTLPQQKAAVEFNKIWDTPTKEDRKNQKLKVEYIYPHSQNPLPTVPEGIELESPVQIEKTSQSASNFAYDLDRAPPSSYDGAAGSSDALLAELQSLRKKYDAIVEYTVHLTAERDYHFTQAEEKRKAEGRDKSQKKTTDVTPRQKGLEKGIEKKSNSSSGFSAMLVVLIAFIAFLVGRWVKF